MKISILIADDHTLFRQGLRRILESKEGFTVVGEAADGNEAVQLAKNLRPDIILMDVAMPSLNGLDATKKIKRLLPDTKVIFLTMYEDPFLLEDGRRTGVSGFLPKKVVDRELFEAIHQVSSGNTYFYSSHKQAKRVPSTGVSYETLSVREKEILRLLASGMTNKDISEHLCISVNTVETHRKKIMKKLKLHNLSEIIKYAITYGIIQQ